MTVVLLSGDLAVFSRVEGAGRSIGETVRQATAGPQAVERCASESARLLLVDLSTSGINVGELVAQLKASIAPPRIIAFGPHVHEQRLAEAQSAGCDLVVSRGQFFAQIDSLLRSTTDD